jgi:OOP family OmpA-OmpF porin
MSKLQSIVIASLAVIVSLSVVNSVNAQQPYIGVSVMTPGEGLLTYAPGKKVADYDHFFAKKIYGGLTFDHDLSFEAGALSWGYQFLVPTKVSQSSSTQQLKVNMLYFAGKASIPLSENFNLFTKLGIARTHSDFNGTMSENHMRGLAGFGIDYNMRKNLGLVIEFHRAGSVDGVPQQKLEAGVKWRF